MPDIWSKLDEKIYELRWIIAALLFGLTLIGSGTLLLTKPGIFQPPRPATFVTEQSSFSPDKEIAGVATLQGPVNINTASQSELESLPGIGPVIAGRIINFRKTNGPFKKKEDLLKVKGIGPKTFAELKDKVTVQ